tara:strand:+ start:187 stop:411 length:225 start_codon:yes stop_codon:yes gene_type:complete
MQLIFISVLFFLIPNISYAYIGPGMAGGIIVATIGVVIAIIAAIFGFLWFPIKKFLKNRKKRQTQIQDDDNEIK